MPFKLFPFQEEDVSKFEYTNSVLFAYEMGLGKSVIGCERDRRIRFATTVDLFRTLVICPKSVFSVWEDHFEKHCPELRVVTFNTAKKEQTWLDFDFGDVLIINYESVGRVLGTLLEYRWQHIICDEVHKIKSRKAQQTQAVKKIPAPWKTALTGTPISNKPHDLWSILNWLDRPNYKAFWKFFDRYVEYTLEPVTGFRIVAGTKNEAELQRKIAPIYVKRKKSLVMPDLLDKVYTEVKVSLGSKQRRAYNEMRKEALAWVGQHEDQPVLAPVSVAKMVRLEQFTAAYAQVDPETGDVRLMDPSAKLDALVEILENSNGEQVVVFTKFKQLIPLINARLDAANLTYSNITGDMNKDQRTVAKLKFMYGEAKVIAGTIGAMGTGIDGLQVASTVIFLDRSWSPADNVQAEDRLHRHGQKGAVQVIDIMANDTVDLRKSQSLQLKWSWIKAILGE